MKTLNITLILAMVALSAQLEANSLLPGMRKRVDRGYAVACRSFAYQIDIKNPPVNPPTPSADSNAAPPQAGFPVAKPGDDDETIRRNLALCKNDNHEYLAAAVCASDKDHNILKVSTITQLIVVDQNARPVRLLVDFNDGATDCKSE